MRAPIGSDAAELQAKIGYTYTLIFATGLVLMLIVLALVAAGLAWRWWRTHRERVGVFVAAVSTRSDQLAQIGGQVVDGLALVAQALRAHVAQAEDAKAARTAAEALLLGQARAEELLIEVRELAKVAAAGACKHPSAPEA